ncbi:MAG: alpha/beta hydrolase [Pseudomonadota bacterium]
MSLDLDYANRDFIPDAESYPPAWAEAASEFREVEHAIGRARLNLSYGAHERHVFDLFLPAGRPAGLFVFVHGGYWRLFDCKAWSHFAAGVQARSWAVAMPSYRLAPEVRISDITRDVAEAVSAAAARVQGPIVLAGHSAGGHLVARMLNADVDLPGEVAERIIRVVPISPVSDLRPLMGTAMNADFRLTEEAATAESPAHLPQARRAEVTVWVGAEERPAFLDQARWQAENWRVTLRHAPGRHHFDILDLLQEPGSALTRACVG